MSPVLNISNICNYIQVDPLDNNNVKVSRVANDLGF